MQNVYAQFIWRETFIPPATTRYDDVFFLNPNLGWTAESSKINNLTNVTNIYKTTNGVDWELINRITGTERARSIEFYNKSIGFLGSLDSSLYRTKDGGVTWENITSNIGNPISGVCGIAISEGVVYCVGAYFGGAFIAKSLDLGDTWTYKNMTHLCHGLVDVHFLNKDTGFVSGTALTNPIWSTRKAILLSTFDGGNTWNIAYKTSFNDYSFFPDSYEYAWKIFQQNHQNIFVSIQNTMFTSLRILKSSDRGLTWSEIIVDSVGQGPNSLYLSDSLGNRVDTVLEFNRFIQGVGFLDSNTGWVGGHFNGYYETSDGGQSWNYINSGKNYNRYFKLNDSTIYASGDFIYKYSDKALVSSNATSIKSESIIKNVFYHQDNNTINISISLKAKSFIEILIFDSNGKVVSKIDGSVKLPDDYNYSFNSLNLSSGIYYIMLYSDNSLEYKKVLKF